MVESVRTQVNAWLERSLEGYYPVMFVDYVHIKIHRKRPVSSEAFYVALAVTEEGRRDVLGIFNIPTESATGWSDIFDTLKERGVQLDRASQSGLQEGDVQPCLTKNLY